MHPWLEVKFPFPVLISCVTIINRKDSCWDTLRNVEVRAGMTRISEGFTARDRGHHSNKKIEVNTRRRHLEGPAKRFVSEGLASHAGVFRGDRISWGGTKYELP